MHCATVCDMRSDWINGLAVAAHAQSVKGADTVRAAVRGFDAGKRLNGRKRHVVVDTMARCCWRRSPRRRRTAMVMMLLDLGQDGDAVAVAAVG